MSLQIFDAPFNKQLAHITQRLCDILGCLGGHIVFLFVRSVIFTLMHFFIAAREGILVHNKRSERVPLAD